MRAPGLLAGLAVAVLLAAPARSAQQAPLPDGDDAPRFVAVDVFVDAAAPLAAWQVEVTARGDGRVVGVEGGEAPFARPPYHDPAALQGGRIVLAAFDTAAALPAGRHRVATLHLREAGPPVAYHIVLRAAADPGGARVSARATLEPRRGTP